MQLRPISSDENLLDHSSFLCLKDGICMALHDAIIFAFAVNLGVVVGKGVVE